MTYRNLVVGVGSIRETDPVLRSAIQLAKALDARLHVVHGFLLADPLLDAYTRSGYLGEGTLERLTGEYQGAIEAQVAAIPESEGAQIDVHTVPGSPTAAIFEIADEFGAELIIVGQSRYQRFPLSLLGSTNRAILRRSSIPVLLLRDDRPVLPNRVLIATDLSPISQEAVKRATRLAAEGADQPAIRALLVVSESLLLLPLERTVLTGVAEDQLTEFAERISSENSDLAEVEHVVRTGDPATEILAEAESWGADLIVLGTHGRGGLGRLFLGSVAEHVLRNAPCNVFVAPSPHAEQSAGREEAT